MFESAYRLIIYKNGQRLYKSPAAAFIYSNIYTGSFTNLDFLTVDADLSVRDNVVLALLSPEEVETKIVTAPVSSQLKLTGNIVRYTLGFNLNCLISLGFTEESINNILSEVFNAAKITDYSFDLPEVVLPHFNATGTVFSVISSILETVSKAEKEPFVAFIDEEGTYRLRPVKHPYRQTKVSVAADFNTIHLADDDAFLFAAPFRAGQGITVKDENKIITEAKISINGRSSRTKINWEAV